ncbi:Fur family transcriptional regulator [Polaribacter sp. R77954]|uniref:Fur family transcriptional regulator n=1 Tax=Polaribacter sp. R77954 TaxID=3093870 RepID=UPI0037CC060A
MGVIRKTKSVTAILKEFDKLQGSGAISVIDLIAKFSKKFNKTTIYRVLDKLEEDGLLHSFLGKKGLKWYAKCKGCTSTAHHDLHPHFQCLDCGKVDCIPSTINIPSLPNRKVNTTQVLIQGTCENCL